MCPTPFFSANRKWEEFFLSLWTINLGLRGSYVSIFRFLLEVTSYLSLPVSYATCYDHLCLLACTWAWHCFIAPYGWLIYHCVYSTHFLYSFLCPCTLNLQPCPCYGNWSGRDGMGTFVFENVAFPWLYAQACECCFLRHFHVLFLTILHVVLSSEWNNGHF